MRDGATREILVQSTDARNGSVRPVSIGVRAPNFRERRPGAPRGGLPESDLTRLRHHPRLSTSIRICCCELRLHHGCMPHAEHRPTAALSTVGAPMLSDVLYWV